MRIAALAALCAVLVCPLARAEKQETLIESLVDRIQKEVQLNGEWAHMEKKDGIVYMKVHRLLDHSGSTSDCTVVFMLSNQARILDKKNKCMPTPDEQENEAYFKAAFEIGVDDLLSSINRAAGE